MSSAVLGASFHDLVDGARIDAEERMLSRSWGSVERDALARPPALDALAALAPTDKVKIIAEVKRSSPSLGRIASIADPAALASSYVTGGASAISVLTEGRKFGGSLADLEQVRAAVDIPVLRKDFISTEYQVLEARAAGADFVLLIAAVLDQALLARLHSLSRELGMWALVETRTAKEIERSLDVGAAIIGVNARDLDTFALDPYLFGRLADKIPSGVIRVAESAVHGAPQVAQYRADGADVVLVGQALVETSDPVSALQDFIAAG